MTTNVTVYFNEHPDHFWGYQKGHVLRQVFVYTAEDGQDPETIADLAFHWFNAPPEVLDPELVTPGTGLVTRYREAGNRSLSAGDVLRIAPDWPGNTGEDPSGTMWLACALPADWTMLDHHPTVLG